MPPAIVPPRRGQRVKSMILPPFNGGSPFQVVRYAPPNEHPRMGVIERRGKVETRVWLEFDMKGTRCDNRHLTMIALPTVPSIAYEEVPATIGGIGKHVRWNVIFANRKWKEASSLVVSNISDQSVFSEFVDTVVRPFGLCRMEFDADAASDAMWQTTVEVPDGSKLALVAAAFHCAGYSAKPAKDEYVSGAKLAIERYDRSEHMWWNQAQDVAGPLRDVHRWAFDFIPKTFSTIPFTWQSLCTNIALDPKTESHHLPLPLRDFYLTQHILQAQESGDSALSMELEQLRGRPSVTCRLSLLQNQQLLIVAYWSTVAPFDDDNVFMCRLVRFRYMLHGYTSREIGGYNQTAKHLGHGALIRTFRDKPQYRRENLSIDILNQIYKTDGSLRGSGFKGTRGKYGHKDFPRYQPRKRMKRNTKQEDRMRQSSVNVFADYHETSGVASSTSSV